jgi:hypothetical protein
MKFALIALFAATASAFSPQPLMGRICTTTSLNLFGSGGGGGDKKGPGMMDQLAMFVRIVFVYSVQYHALVSFFLFTNTTPCVFSC